MENFIEIIKNNGFEIEEVNFTSNFGINDFMLQDKMILFFDLENDYRLRNFLDYCYDEDVQAYSKHVQSTFYCTGKIWNLIPKKLSNILFHN